MAVDPEKQKEEVALLLSGKVKVRDFGTVVGHLDGAAVGALLGLAGTILISTFGLGYGCGANRNSDAVVAPVERIRSAHVHFEKFMLSNEAQSDYAFLVPSLAYLEDEAASEVKAGRWADSLVVAGVSEPFKSYTPRFEVAIEPAPDANTSGYAFRVHGEKASQEKRLDTMNTEPTIVIESLGAEYGKLRWLHFSGRCILLFSGVG